MLIPLDSSLPPACTPGAREQAGSGHRTPRPAGLWDRDGGNAGRRHTGGGIRRLGRSYQQTRSVPGHARPGMAILPVSHLETFALLWGQELVVRLFSPTRLERRLVGHAERPVPCPWSGGVSPRLRSDKRVIPSGSTFALGSEVSARLRSSIDPSSRRKLRLCCHGIACMWPGPLLSNQSQTPFGC